MEYLLLYNNLCCFRISHFMPFQCLFAATSLLLSRLILLSMKINIRETDTDTRSSAAMASVSGVKKDFPRAMRAEDNRMKLKFIEVQSLLRCFGSFVALGLTSWEVCLALPHASSQSPNEIEKEEWNFLLYTTISDVIIIQNKAFSYPPNTPA